MKNNHTDASSTLMLKTGSEQIEVSLYSSEGLELLSNLWIKAGAQHKIMYQPTWLGRPIIQFPNDIVAIQELIWSVKPDLIIETGVAHGGSLVLSASILELIGSGRAVGIDVDIRSHNREALDNHPLRHRFDLVEGSSVDPAIVRQMAERANDLKSVMVILDSNHSADHVRQELEVFHNLITPGSYVVVHDGAQAWVSDIPRGKAEWETDHPLAAIDDFLKDHPEFEIDPKYTRTLITSSPNGFLKRLK
jgi:cephalosporin hydroxylase